MEKAPSEVISFIEKFVFLGIQTNQKLGKKSYKSAGSAQAGSELCLSQHLLVGFVLPCLCF